MQIEHALPDRRSGRSGADRQRPPAGRPHRPGLHSGVRVRAPRVRAPAPDRAVGVGDGRAAGPERRDARLARKLGIAAHAASLAGLVALHRNGRATRVRSSKRRSSTSSVPTTAAASASRSARGPRSRSPAGSCCVPDMRTRKRYRAARDISLRRRRRAQPPRRVEARRPPGRRRGARALPGARRRAGRSGKKEGQGEPLMAHLAERGWVCVTANYRLSPRATWPDHIVDVKKALAWTKATIAAARRRPRLRRRSPAVRRAATSAPSPRSPRTSPTSSPASRTPTRRWPRPCRSTASTTSSTATAPAAPTCEGFLAKTRLQVAARRRSGPLGAGVDDQPRRAARPAVLRAPRHQRLARARRAGAHVRRRSCARRRSSRSSTPSCPARSTRSRSSRRSGRTPPRTRSSASSPWCAASTAAARPPRPSTKPSSPHRAGMSNSEQSVTYTSAEVERRGVCVQAQALLSLGQVPRCRVPPSASHPY